MEEITILKLNNFVYNKDFYHEYQPIYNLFELRVLGFESFFRSEIYSNPEHVFQLAMKTNNLYELDTHSIFKSISHFYDHYQTDKNLLFVNVFPFTLLNSDFPSFLDHLSKQLKVSCSQIVFEINEAKKIEDMTLLYKAVSHLRSYGFLIAIDDIGKGDSDLQKIIELEPDFIKLDRYFSINLSLSNKKQRFINLLMDFTKDYSQIILEGIEKPEDLTVAKELGIPFGQGFLLGEPSRHLFSGKNFLQNTNNIL
ncbi:diguanylate phosphodiesterase [Collibacillus ludicampi]|uniref:Diguanylate phosphodiesterase n=1 Tax=Collibacillus ludicampi TaxID=2771369 RepID=A0AAV4LB40_9BACL|nr:EAL domain-containing protein [Collibacillus ludicampi]GIM45017.1 diguanylate phosphodiesterase [Collibacillus ludicampi]